MRGERVGLLMVASSLLVILVISGLLLHYQRDARREQARIQGVSLVRLLSRVPYERLVRGGGEHGPLQVIKHTQRNPDFAYAVIVDAGGRLLAEVTTPGAIVPGVSIGADPSSWLGERVLEPPGEGRRIHDFSAPILSGGRVVAHVRIGFFEPGYGIALEQAPFFGLLALPIFLLTPLSYLLIRREVRPLSAASAQLQSLVEGDSLTSLQIEATGELGEFMRAFNRFVETAEDRFHALQDEHTGLLASSKVVSYQKSRIESVLDTLPDAAIVLDGTGTVTYANAKLESLAGIPVEGALGHKPHDWCQNPELLAFLARFYGSGDRLSRADSVEFSPEESSQKQLRVVAQPLVPTTSGLAIPGTLVLFRDVTSESIAKEGQAEFVSHIAHELKSPLNVLGMYSETLLGKDGESEDFRVEACNVIHDEVERLSTLIGSLLSIARIEAGAVALDRQRVRLPDFLRDIQDTLSRAGMRTDLDFALDVAVEFSPIWVDKDLLRVAINNLLTNAIKYNREGGTVALSAEETSESICIRVRDAGAGISPENQRSVFEKFFRADDPAVEKVGGHGLGLTLAKQIVELHGGDITLVSTPGEGSEFSILLRKTPALLQEAHPS